HSIKMLHKTHFVAGDKQAARVMAIESGVDLEGPTTECFGELLLDAVQNGSLAESTIDRSVRRHLESKYRKGLFDSQDPVNEGKIEKNFGASEGEELAREAGRESIVLLKNENGLLPLSDELESVAVIGPNADSKRNLLGDYAFSGHMEGEKTSGSITSVLEGIKDRVREDAKIFYAEGSKVQGNSHEGFGEAIKAANNSELVISVVGGKSGFGFFPPEEREENFGQTSGEGNDRTDLKLPGVQRELMQEIYQTDTPMIAILLNGRPLSINWIHENLPAVLEAWLPGEEGGNAIADVLFGDYNPGGKLPVTVPKNVGQTPLHYRRKPISKERRYVSNDNQPLYPFGFGLSYTNFDYSGLSIAPRKVESTKSIDISCNLTNTGDVSGAEVVQLYIRDEYASVTRPERELKGFEKIKLDPGEKKKVSFKLPTDLLGFYDRDMDLVVEPGDFEVMIGSSSEDIRLKGKFEVKSERKIPASERNYFTKTSIE
ncbi:glycoside hydrolase family 3 C-terminal domain-containing protein, partial [Candidatus Bipolaricaulota bacterium]|nr:glycoside hydrolase family 3 C-terminal domain-containing protein [Candidatus Bipolaricaulota bacterium]